MWPQSCQRYQVIITSALVSLLHPQVLRPGRAECGAFRSTPALHMIRARTDSVVSIFSSETYDTHTHFNYGDKLTGLSNHIYTYAHAHMHPVQSLWHTCLSNVTVGYFLLLVTFLEIRAKVCEAYRARHGAVARV